MTQPARLDEQPDFSLVLGGPVYQMFRRARLAGDALELLRRRMLFFACLSWVPLLFLSALEGHALGGTIAIPFLNDIEAHVRFLVALPILIAAELIVHLRLRPMVAQFVVRRIVTLEDVPRFNEAIAATRRLRNSVPAEVALLVLVYTLGLWVWRNQVVLGTPSWYAIPEAGHMNLTAAGYWLAFVSVPAFQFILLRWYFRFFLWFSFLWRVSRLDLRLVATHPDRAAGLSFLGRSTHAFAPILLAQGALLGGLIASQIFYAGAQLVSFKVQVAGFVIVFLVGVLSPLTVFMPSLMRAKREGLGDYGRLASRYTQEFEEKWVRGGAQADEQLLGTGDIQSLADLGNSYSVVQEMRIVPFGVKDVTRLAAVVVAPLLPLTLTIFSLEELLNHLLKVLL